MTIASRSIFASLALAGFIGLIAVFADTVYAAPVMPPAPEVERPIIQAKSLFEFLFGTRRDRPERSRQNRERRPSSNSRHRTPAAAAPASRTAKLPDAKHVVVIGDAFASGLAKALVKRFADTPSVVIVNRAKSGTGIVRYDHYNWDQELGPILDTEKPAALIVMIGSNDRQDIVDSDGNKYTFRTLSWLNIYERRVQNLLDHASARNIPLYWVGMPIMRSQEFGRDIAFLNEIFAQQSNRINAVFVDTWERFADEKGKYNASGPDEIGRIRRLRNDNGIHLTRQGNRKLAYFVDLELRPRLVGLFAMLETDPNRSLDGDPRSRVLGVEISLTRPPINPGDINLAGARNEVASNQESIISSDAQPEPQSGRADDFSWPKRRRHLGDEMTPPL